MHRKFPILCACALLAGCVGVAKFPTIEPISFRPSGTRPEKAVEVHTVKPTFSWKPAAGVGAYDFAIWRVSPDGAPGESEYSAENIESTEHTPTNVLLPGEYFWSVRPHGSTAWATASFTQVNPLWVSWGRGLPFRIKVSAK